MAHLKDCFTHWSVLPDIGEALAGAEVIVTHEFGDQKSVSRTTRQIAELGIEFAKKLGKPLICQAPGDEVAARLKIRPFCVIRRHELRPGAYLDTEEVNRQVTEICRTYGWQRVILCAHPHHLWRAGLNLTRHGMTVLYPNTSGIGYDAHCARLALQSPYIFIPREVLARILYLRKGWI